MMWLFLYINYYEIKGRETHVAWVMSATVNFNNILIPLLSTLDISVCRLTERTKITHVIWFRD